MGKDDAHAISSVICVTLGSDCIFPSCFRQSPPNTARRAIRSKVSTFILKQRILDLTQHFLNGNRPLRVHIIIRPLLRFVQMHKFQESFSSHQSRWQTDKDAIFRYGLPQKTGKTAHLHVNGQRAGSTIPL